MSRSPKGLEALRLWVEVEIGPEYFLGIVPARDKAWQWGRFGYHYGLAEIPANDESSWGARNDVGSSHGWYWSAAFDLGMGWKGSRSWLRWLIDSCARGKFTDLHGVIGSLDGKTQTYWNVDNGWRGEPYVAGYGDHTTHTHLEWWRDAVHRSQVAVVSTWPGWQPPAPRPSPQNSPSRPPESPVEPSAPPAEPPGNPLDLTALTAGAVLAGLAWIINRRMRNADT